MIIDLNNSRCFLYKWPTTILFENDVFKWEIKAFMKKYDSYNYHS